MISEYFSELAKVEEEIREEIREEIMAYEHDAELDELDFYEDDDVDDILSWERVEILDSTWTEMIEREYLKITEKEKEERKG